MKKAFTIAEFILCLVIMSTVLVGMLTVSFKKSKMTATVQRTHNEIVCSCSDEEVIRNDYVCEIQIENPTGRHEFYTIQLLGGGAAGSTCRGGAAGEAKIITYPSLETGTYYIKLGAGGTSARYNGGSTVLYKKDENNRLRVVEFARGGMAEINNAPCVYEELEAYSDASLRAEAEEKIKKGEAPTFGAGQTFDSNCGAGGDYQASGNQSGNYGEVIIKW